MGSIAAPSAGRSSDPSAGDASANSAIDGSDLATAHGCRAASSRCPCDGEYHAGRSAAAVATLSSSDACGSGAAIGTASPAAAVRQRRTHAHDCDAWQEGATRSVGRCGWFEQRHLHGRPREQNSSLEPSSFFRMVTSSRGPFMPPFPLLPSPLLPSPLRALGPGPAIGRRPIELLLPSRAPAASPR